ncbi:MAG: transposase [Arachidicoccus sp.]|nr:transposase [Arachidicoccus sp.]
MRTRLFTEEFKKKAVVLSVSRGSVKEVAEELGIRAELLSKWRSNPLYNGGHLLADNLKLSEEQLKIRRLEKELREIKLESEILKKALGIFSRNERNTTHL